MKTHIVDRPGGPFHEVDIAIPEPASHEVLVKICASGINPLDTKIRAGQGGHPRGTKCDTRKKRSAAGIAQRCPCAHHGAAEGGCSESRHYPSRRRKAITPVTSVSPDEIYRLTSVVSKVARVRPSP